MATTNPLNHRLAMALATLIALGTSTVMAAPAQATAPGVNGRLATAYGGSLQIMDPDGSNLVAFTPACFASELSWAPDGTRLVFAGICGTSNTDHDILSIRIDGSDARTLVATKSDETNPSMSPDGTTLVYVSNRSGSEDLYLADANGSHRRRLTTGKGAETWPAWSPDGSQLAYVAHPGQHCQVMVVGKDGTHSRVLARESRSTPSYLECPGGPTWAPDGRRIAYPLGLGHWERIWVSLINGQSARRLTTLPAYAPEWSPDGTRIAYGDAATSVVSDAGQLVSSVTGTSPTWEPVSGTGPAHIWFLTRDSATVGHAIEVVGELDVPGGVASGQTIDVYATPPGGSRTLVTSLISGRGGRFATTVTPDAPGVWTIDASWAGDGAHNGSTFALDTAVAKRAPSISLAASDGRIGFGHSVRLTATLKGAPAHARVTVARVETDGSLTRMGSGQVNRHGSWSVSVRPSQNSHYVANYQGAAWYTGATSRKVQVLVNVAVSASQSGYFARSGKYRLYHSTSSCKSRHVGCPTFTIKVRPSNPRGYVYFCLSTRRPGDHWRTQCANFRLNDQSRTSVIITYDPSSVAGVESRVMVSAGAKNLSFGKTPYLYFKIL